MIRIPLLQYIPLTLLLLLSCGKEPQTGAKKNTDPRLEAILDDRSLQLIVRKNQLDDSLLISMMNWKDRAGNWTIADLTERNSSKQKLKLVLKHDRFYITVVQKRHYTEVIYIDRKSGYFRLPFQTSRRISSKKQLVDYVLLENSMICDQLIAAWELSQTTRKESPEKVDRAYFLRTDLVMNTFGIVYIDESKDRVNAAMADVLSQLGKSHYSGLEEKLGEAVTGKKGFLHTGKIEPALSYETEIDGSGWLDDSNIRVSATIVTHDFICLDPDLRMANSATLGYPATFRTYINRHRKIKNTQLLSGTQIPPDYFIVYYVRFGVKVSGKLSNGDYAQKTIYITGKLAAVTNYSAFFFLDTHEMRTSTYSRIVK